MLNGKIVLFHTIKYWKHISGIYIVIYYKHLLSELREISYFSHFTSKYVMQDFCSSEGVIQEKALRVYKLGDVIYIL